VIRASGTRASPESSMRIKLPLSAAGENAKQRAKVPSRPEPGLKLAPATARWIARADGRTDASQARQTQ
jgi:hypothetical protein